MNCTRRRCLGGIAAVASGVAIGVGTAKAVGPLWNRPQSPYRSFTENEAKTLIAVCEQFIPRDEFPGATDAGVIDYIDLQISKGHPFESLRGPYKKWLAAVDILSRRMSQKPFVELRWDDQTAVLKAAQNAPEAKDFFQTVLTHTNQGFYCSPIHGGNRNYAGYHSVGLDQPRICGRHRPERFAKGA